MTATEADALTVLTTTRTVRRRLDLDRPVDLSLVRQCVAVAMQAPNGANRQAWIWLAVADAPTKQRIAELYRTASAAYLASAVDGAPPAVERELRSVRFLAEHLHRVPVLVFPCLLLPGGLRPGNQAGQWGSLLPAAWSYMLAARSLGLATAWTTTHLAFEREIADLLNLPDDARQAVMIPTAYPTGDPFRPGRRGDVDEVFHVDRYSPRTPPSVRPNGEPARDR